MSVFGVFLLLLPTNQLPVVDHPWVQTQIPIQIHVAVATVTIF